MYMKTILLVQQVKIVNCLNDHRIPIDNLTGLAPDGASNIMSEHDALSNKNAPKAVRSLIRNINSFFQSAKRIHE